MAKNENKNWFEKEKWYCFLCGYSRNGITIYQHLEPDEDYEFKIYGGKVYFEQHGLHICKICLKKMIKELK